ncbi:RNA-guided endonuclease InsQ/TnpB family protein [Streptomyces sp. NPDC004393]
MVVQVKLLPSAEQAPRLLATLHTCNKGADLASRVAFDKREFSKFGLQKLVYAELKSMGLGAQAAIRSIKKVVDAYGTLHAHIKAGNLGRPGSKRRLKAETKPVEFRPDAAQPYDDRLLSWQYDQRTVSVWTTAGRVKGVRFVGHPDHLNLLAEHRQGETDLVHRDGAFYLLATCEVPEDEPNEDPSGFTGVDLGIVNIATTSTGARHCGRRLNRQRKQMRDLRTKLQKRRTKSARRAVKRVAGRERRRATDVNHCISKRIVAEAERTGQGIALEDLRGIRERVRLRKPQRAAVHSWAFAQLGRFLTYKARRCGVPLLQVDPRNTSRECSSCHHIDKRNRPAQAEFRCVACGFVDHADANAARNIAARGWWAWVCGVESTTPALAVIA